MGLSELMLGSPFPTAGLLLAIATVVALRAFARRCAGSEDVTAGSAEKLPQQFRRSIPTALSLVHAQLNDLAEEMDDLLPQKFRLIDQMIHESDREIARLQRRLAKTSSAEVSLNRREPDVLLLEDFEANRIAVPVVPQLDDRTIRRAA